MCLLIDLTKFMHVRFCCADRGAACAATAGGGRPRAAEAGTSGGERSSTEPGERGERPAEPASPAGQHQSSQREQGRTQRHKMPNHTVQQRIINMHM